MGNLVHRSVSGRWVVCRSIDYGRYTGPVRRHRYRVQQSTITGSLSDIESSGYSYSRRVDAMRRARMIYATD